MATNSRVPEVVGVAALFLSLTWITTALRCYVRGFMAKSFGIEDWLAILAQLLFTLTASFALQGIQHSMGMHLIEIPLQNLAPAMMYWFSVELAYTMTTCVLKLSIAFFLLRIATKKLHRIILYAIICLVTVLTIAYFLFLVFQCTPVSYFWLQFGGETGSCVKPEVVGAMTYTHSAVNAFCDVILALLPVVIVSQLQMNIRTKLTVSTILSMGIIAAIAVIIRIPYIKILVDNASDFLYSSTDVVIWSAIEPGLAITAANMATLRPLFQAFLSHTKLWGDTTRGKSGYGHSKSRSRNMGNSSGMGGRKGYIRSGSQGNITDLGLDGDEVGLKDLGSMNEKGGKERSAITITTISSQDGYGSQPSIRSTEWDLEQGRDHRRSRSHGRGQGGNIGNREPIAIRKTVQTQVTSRKEEGDGNEIVVSMRMPSQRNGAAMGRRQSVGPPMSGGHGAIENSW